MRRILRGSAWAILVAVVGCGPEAPPPPVVVEQPPPLPAQRRPRAEPPARRGPSTDISYDTDKDRRFAEFVREKAGGMVKAVAVGLERKHTFRVELGDEASPEDTLPLTKSLMKGATKDFPDQPITLAVYDPSGAPILKAHYRPGHDIRYEVAHAEGRTRPKAGPSDEEFREAPAAPPAKVHLGGATETDRRFAEWAMKTAPDYLRYVEPDLDRHGRLWLGITREVKPEDVKPLTKSLLEGARTEFPRKELAATVFDPDGERIGKATLDARGELVWTK
jgi:hypothetical protein